MLKQVIVSLLCALLASGCSLIEQPLSKLALSEKINTYCFGRYLVDVPEEAELMLQEPEFACIENGAISDEGKTDQPERTYLGFWLKNYHDVKIGIHSAPSFSEEQFILKEQAHAVLVEDLPQQQITKPTAEVEMIYPKTEWIIKRARSGSLTVNGMEGEESLVYFPSDNEPGIAHNFTWGTPGKVNDPQRPNILLEISSGGSGYKFVDRRGENGIVGALRASSLPTGDMVRLYDAIVKSIRLRPTASEKAPANLKP
jgi:hypothetical protein